MGDLISRSAVMSRIESEYRQWGEDCDAEQILGDIEDLPSAYDVHIVIQQLEDLRQKEIALMCRHISDAEYMKSVIEHTVLVDAIEIVKSGGINV